MLNKNKILRILEFSYLGYPPIKQKQGQWIIAYIISRVLIHLLMLPFMLVGVTIIAPIEKFIEVLKKYLVCKLVGCKKLKYSIICERCEKQMEQYYES